MPDPYLVLGIPPTATADEIRRAYQRAAARHHPDRGGDVTKFQEVKAAYEALKNRTCPDCDGSGFILKQFGFFTEKSECPTCWKRAT